MQTTTAPVRKEVFIQAPPERIWKAITDKDEMKLWYFTLDDFKPEPGFTFQFEGTDGKVTFTHLCKIIEAIPLKKLTYSWSYQGFAGESYVTFELFPEGEGTRVRLTHEGLESFAVNNNPAFDKKNFEAGWNEIIGKLLKDFAEKAG